MCGIGGRREWRKITRRRRNKGKGKGERGENEGEGGKIRRKGREREA